MRKPIKSTKLPFNAATIRHLEPSNLGHVVGGQRSGPSTRPSSECPNPSGG